MLASETFEPDELNSVLVSRGEDESEVTAAIERALATRGADPAEQRSLAARRRAGRLLRAGIFWLVVGLAFSLWYGAGLLSYLLILGVGAALIAAGARELRRA